MIEGQITIGSKEEAIMVILGMMETWKIETEDLQF